MGVLIAALLPAIPHIILGVEALFGKGGGASKKQVATNLLADLANGFSVESGAPGANSALMTFLSAEIDNVVTYLNATGALKHAA